MCCLVNRSVARCQRRGHRALALFLLNGMLCQTLAMTYRDATAADTAFLREMLYLALFVPPGLPPFPRSVLDEPGIDRYVRGWTTWTGDLGLIPFANGAPVGAAWLRQFTGEAPGYGFIDNDTPELTIAAIETHRNQGIGRQLIAGLQDRAPRISLSCDLLNPAKRLYLRAGFEPWSADGRTLVWSPAVPSNESIGRG
jgi:GNAT superfamily N-acetyltransferase